MILSTPTKKIYNNQNTSYVNACMLPLLSASVLLLLLFAIRISVGFVVVAHSQCFPCEVVVIVGIRISVVVVIFVMLN